MKCSDNSLSQAVNNYGVGIGKYSSLFAQGLQHGVLLDDKLSRYQLMPTDRNMCLLKLSCASS